LGTQGGRAILVVKQGSVGCRGNITQLVVEYIQMALGLAAVAAKSVPREV
jgi:hypothetical protein